MAFSLSVLLFLDIKFDAVLDMLSHLLERAEELFGVTAFLQAWPRHGCAHTYPGVPTVYHKRGYSLPPCHPNPHYYKDPRLVLFCSTFLQL